MVRYNVLRLHGHYYSDYLVQANSLVLHIFPVLQLKQMLHRKSFISKIYMLTSHCSITLSYSDPIPYWYPGHSGVGLYG